MQDEVRAHTTMLTLEIMKDKKKHWLLEPHYWPPNSPDLNPVDFGIWGLLERNVYQSRRITNLDSLKEAIVEEWNKIPEEITDKSIAAFKRRLWRVIEVQGRHIGWCWLLIIHIDIPQYVFLKSGLILINYKKVITTSVRILYW